MRYRATAAVLLAVPLAALAASAAHPSGAAMRTDPSTVQGDLTSLEAALKDPDARKRRNAVIGLAKLGSDGAWDLLFAHALSDRSPQVADEVQLQLGSAALDDAMIRRFDSREGLRARDETVRLRVVEALGRIGGAVPAGLLERAL
jgi:HEAT repeat protein